MNEPLFEESGTPPPEKLFQEIERVGTLELGEWFAAEYDELRTLARRLMTRERDGHTLSASALLHEACIRLLKSKRPQAYDQRNHFFAAVRLAMSQVLIDHARHRKATIAGRLNRDSSESVLDRLVDTLSARQIDCLDFASALEALGQAEPRPATAVSLHYFFDWKQPEIADYLDVSLATIENDLKFAKTWLRRRLQGDRES